MNIILKPLTEKDRSEFIAFHHRVYRDVVERRFGWDEVLQDKFANESFDKGRLQRVILDGVDVGIIRFIDEPTYIHIDEIMLAREFQGRGIAVKMVDYVVDMAKAAQKKVCAQTIHKDRPRGLFERMGFIVTGETDTHWQLMIPIK